MVRFRDSLHFPDENAGFHEAISQSPRIMKASVDFFSIICNQHLRHM